MTPHAKDTQSLNFRQDDFQAFVRETMRKHAVTVRLFGARMAPITKTSASVQVRLEKCERKCQSGVE